MLRCTPFSVIPIISAISLIDTPPPTTQKKRLALSRRHFRHKTVNSLAQEPGVDAALDVLVELRSRPVNEIGKRLGRKGI